jgi:hypothetical protein
MEHPRREIVALDEKGGSSFQLLKGTKWATNALYWSVMPSICSVWKEPMCANGHRSNDEGLTGRWNCRRTVKAGAS